MPGRISDIGETKMFLAKSVVLPVNRGWGYENGFELACSLTKASRGIIYAIYVIEVKLEYPLDSEIDEETAKGEETLAYIEDLAKGTKCLVEAQIMQARQAGPAILQEADNISADIILLDTKRTHGSNGFPMGRTSSYILKHSLCPVILCQRGIENTSKSERG